MGRFVLERRQVISRPVDEVFSFFADAHNLEAITPDFLRFQILTADPIDMGVGTVIDYRLRLYGLPQRWRTRIVEWDPPKQFADLQVSGPYRYWKHTHTFRPLDHETEMVDRVEYELPFGPIGRIVHALVVRRALRQIFDYRHQRIAALLGPVRDGAAEGE